MSEGSDPTREMQGFGPTPTAVIPRVPEASARPAVVGLTFLAAAAAAFLVGIAAASTFRGPPPGAVLASERAGPSGGTIRFEGGEIRIPPGALASPTELVVRRTVVARRVEVRPPGAAIQVFAPRELAAYVFEPADIDFLRPVSLLFRLRDQAGGATTFARVGETTLLLETEVDAERGTVEIEISDFRFNRGQPTGPR